MEFLIALLLAGAAIWFFKRNTRSGADTVRAYVFLRAINRGASVEDANRQAAYDVASGPTETITEAMEYVRVGYGGSQLALLADAKQAGLVLGPDIASGWRTESRDEKADLMRDFGNGATKIPALSRGMIESADATILWCRSEISSYVGKPVDVMPNYGLGHDINVGSYICGFLQGQLLESGHLKQWAGGDDDLEYLGYYTLAVSCLPALLGRERALRLVDHLPQIGPGAMTENIRLMDTAGGNAGMNHVAGRDKDAILHLSYYLKQNVAA